MKLCCICRFTDAPHGETHTHTHAHANNDMNDAARGHCLAFLLDVLSTALLVYFCTLPENTVCQKVAKKAKHQVSPCSILLFPMQTTKRHEESIICIQLNGMGGENKRILKLRSVISRCHKLIRKSSADRYVS